MYARIVTITGANDIDAGIGCSVRDNPRYVGRVALYERGLFFDDLRYRLMSPSSDSFHVSTPA